MLIFSGFIVWNMFKTTVVYPAVPGTERPTES